MKQGCRYWWVNCQYMNYEDGVIKRGFNDWGFVTRYKKSVENKIQIGDKLVIYIIRLMLFGGMLEVISNLYFDETRPEYPWRFKTRPIILSPLESLPTARTIFNQLEIIDPNNPGAKIQGAIKFLSEKDYLTIYKFLKTQPNIALCNEKRLSSFEKHKQVKEVKRESILDFINGKPGNKYVSNAKLSEWIEFCYKNEMYKEALRLFNFIDQTKIDTDTYKKANKIIEACQIKIN